MSSVGRRALLWGGAGAVGLAAAGGGALAYDPAGRRLRRALGDDGPAGAAPPEDPEGVVRLVTVRSAARSRDLGLWTAVPAGLGDGAGLPVCLVLHGASATTADFSRFGLGRFLTAAARAGVPPFALVGADGGRSFWLGGGGGSADDPQRMLAEELPAWCLQRGFDASRLAAYGWSMGAAGALRAAQLQPGRLRAVSALSPAVRAGDPVTSAAGRLVGARTALWCGRDDALFPAVQALAATVPGGPAVAAWAPGQHTRRYWNTVTPAAFAFAGHALTPT